MEIELIHVLGLCVHLKDISVSTSALTAPQWDYISQHNLSFVTATAIMASLQIHNWPILISSSRVQMWMARINPPYFDGLHITGDICGYYSWLQCSLWPRHDHSNLCDMRIETIASFPWSIRIVSSMLINPEKTEQNCYHYTESGNGFGSSVSS